MNTKDDNVISFFDEKEARLLQASREPPKGNWLSKLPKDTRFLASKNAMNDCDLHDFLVGTDPTKMPAVLIGYELAHRNGGFRWVDPAKFSRDYSFFMTIEASEFENGNSSEVQTGRLESDGTAEVVDRIHEEE